MIELRTDPFDSGVWQKKVCRMRVDEPVDAQELRAAMDAERPDIAYAFAAFHPEITKALFQAGFHLISIRTTYARTLKDDATPVAAPLPDGFRITARADGVHPSEASIRELARTIGATSRYFNDPRIPEAGGQRLYEAWIANSLYHGYADEVFTVQSGNETVGLITLKIKDGVGVIDLIGLLPPYQGKGLGAHLLGSALHFFRSRDIQDIVVVTEGENVSALGFYQSNGFIVRDLSMVFHAHPTYV